MAWVKAQHDVYALYARVACGPYRLPLQALCTLANMYLGALNADVGVLSPFPKSQGFAGNVLPQTAQ